MSSVDITLLEILHKILSGYFPVSDPLALCNTIETYDPDAWKGIHACVESEKGWWGQNGVEVSNKYITGLKNDDDGLKLLGLAGTFNTTIQSCPSDTLELSELQYLYLWNTPNGAFCKVMTTDGLMYYTSIAHIKFMSDIAIGQQPLSNIGNQFLGNLLSINVNDMRTACTSLSYSDMSNALLADICGCYVALPPPGTTFSTDERSFLEQSPQCLPSCLDARIRYTQGGQPIPCQQDLCIADKIDVSSHTTITQICNQCTHKYQCVCYIHVNGQTINDESCNTIYQVDGKGNITGKSSNQPQGATNFLKKWWEIIRSSKMILIIIIVITVLILITVIALFIVQRNKHGTSVTPKPKYALPEVKDNSK